VGALLRGVPLVSPLFAGGPLLAALLTAGLVDGRAGLRDLGQRLLRWRVAPRWYAVVLALPIILVAAAVALNTLLGGTAPHWTNRPDLATTGLMLALFLFLPIGAPLSEEVGWRGYALPRLLASRSALTASLIIGVLWSVWHLPVVLTDPATRPPAPFLLQVPPLAVLFTWVFVNTRGSLLIAIVFHAWYDLVLMYVVAMVVSADYERVFWLLAAMQVLAAVVVLLVARWRPASRALAVGA